MNNNQHTVDVVVEWACELCLFTIDCQFSRHFW